MELHMDLYLNLQMYVYFIPIISPSCIINIMPISVSFLCSYNLFFIAKQQDGVEQDNEMMVPKHLVGRIIGKGGSNIRQLREASGARIDVSCVFNDDFNGHNMLKYNIYVFFPHPLFLSLMNNNLALFQDRNDIHSSIKIKCCKGACQNIRIYLRSDIRNKAICRACFAPKAIAC